MSGEYWSTSTCEMRGSVPPVGKGRKAGDAQEVVSIKVTAIRGSERARMEMTVREKMRKIEARRGTVWVWVWLCSEGKMGKRMEEIKDGARPLTRTKREKKALAVAVVLCGIAGMEIRRCYALSNGVKLAL